MHDRRDCLGPGLGVQVRGMPAVAKVVSFFFSLWILCRLPAPPLFSNNAYARLRMRQACACSLDRGEKGWVTHVPTFFFSHGHKELSNEEDEFV